MLGGLGQWRTLLAHSDCEGFSLVVDPNDELIFEQTCHPYQVKSGFKPKLGGEQQRVTAAAATGMRKEIQKDSTPPQLSPPRSV